LAGDVDDLCVLHAVQRASASAAAATVRTNPLPPSAAAAAATADTPLPAAAATAAVATANTEGCVSAVHQGLTLAHCSAQLEHFVWDRECT
jgi:hypothetical protein